MQYFYGGMQYNYCLFFYYYIIMLYIYGYIIAIIFNILINLKIIE